MWNFNDIFRKEVPYDNIKSHKKPGFNPLFRRYSRFRVKNLFIIESAKLSALRAHVLTCLACLCIHVPMSLPRLRAHVATCLACLRAHMPTCLAWLRAYVPTCLACLRVHVLTYQRALHAHVPTCLAYLLTYVSWVLTCSRALRA